MTDDDRSPLERVKDAVAAALGRRPPREQVDDADRTGVGDLGEPIDPGLLRTAGMVARPMPPPADEDGADR